MRNLWSSAWIRPRETMAVVLQENPVKRVFTLAILNGIVTALSWLAFYFARDERRIELSLGIVVSLLVSGVILGLIHLYVGGWLYKVTGRWLGGKGDFIALRNTVGWGSYPFLVAGILSVLAYATDRSLPIAALIFGALNMIVATWALILFIFFIAEAHRFSFWRALAALVIAAVIVFAVLMLLSLFFPLLTPIFK